MRCVNYILYVAIIDACVVYLMIYLCHSLFPPKFSNLNNFSSLCLIFIIRTPMHALHYSLRYIICYIFLISLIHSCFSAVQTCVLLWFSFFPVWVLKMINCLVFTPLNRIRSSFKADTVLLLTQSLIGSLTLAGTSKTLISMECFIKDDVTQVHPRSYELFPSVFFDEISNLFILYGN